MKGVAHVSLVPFFNGWQFGCILARLHLEMGGSSGQGNRVLRVGAGKRLIEQNGSRCKVSRHVNRRRKQPPSVSGPLSAAVRQ